MVSMSPFTYIYHNQPAMGGCLEALFGSHRSSLKQDTLLNYQELATIIKPSTRNDNWFYSSHNLSAVEQFLCQYSSKPNMPIDTAFINGHVDTLCKFMLDLKDSSCQIGKQILIDKERIESYVDKNGNLPNIKSNAVILKLEVQALLLSASLIEELSYHGEWDLVIDILEEHFNAQGKSKQKSYPNREISTSCQNQVEPQVEVIQTIWVNHRKNQMNHLPTNESRRKISSQIEQSHNKASSDAEDYQLFCFTAKVVNKNSRINISLSKVKRRKYSTSMEAQKDSINKSGVGQKDWAPESKRKMLVGSTCLSVSDFIYYNSLIVSDVVSLSRPSSIKSSITTASSSNANAVAFISLRGQGLRGQTLEKDYIKIIKQHEAVVQQLQLCLQGERGWEKLSEFRNSSESQKNESLYSEYTMPQQRDKLYRV